MKTKRLCRVEPPNLSHTIVSNRSFLRFSCETIRKNEIFLMRFSTKMFFMIFLIEMHILVLWKSKINS